jgi:hypothetical protein
VVEVLRWIDPETLWVRNIRERFCETFDSLIELGKKVVLSVRELLFEKRVKHDGCGSGVLHALYVVQVLGQRARRRYYGGP